VVENEKKVKAYEEVEKKVRKWKKDNPDLKDSKPHTELKLKLSDSEKSAKEN